MCVRLAPWKFRDYEVYVCRTMVLHSVCKTSALEVQRVYEVYVCRAMVLHSAGQDVVPSRRALSMSFVQVAANFRSRAFSFRARFSSASICACSPSDVAVAEAPASDNLAFSWRTCSTHTMHTSDSVCISNACIVTL